MSGHDTKEVKQLLDKFKKLFFDPLQNDREKLVKTLGGNGNGDYYPTALLKLKESEEYIDLLKDAHLLFDRIFYHIITKKYPALDEKDKKYIYFPSTKASLINFKTRYPLAVNDTLNNIADRIVDSGLMNELKDIDKHAHRIFPSLQEKKEIIDISPKDFKPTTKKGITITNFKINVGVTTHSIENKEVTKTPYKCYESLKELLNYTLKN